MAERKYYRFKIDNVPAKGMQNLLTGLSNLDGVKDVKLLDSPVPSIKGKLLDNTVVLYDIHQLLKEHEPSPDFKLIAR